MYCSVIASENECILLHSISFYAFLDDLFQGIQVAVRQEMFYGSESQRLLFKLKQSIFECESIEGEYQQSVVYDILNVLNMKKGRDLRR